MITLSAFDSEIFGLRVGWSGALHATEDLGDYDLVFLRGGFPTDLHLLSRLIDVRYDLARGPGAASDVPLYPARALDMHFCCELAERAFEDTSRYFCDLRLRPRAHLVYRKWILGAFQRGDLYCIPDRGFVAVSSTSEALRLDLIAVSPSHRKEGVGRALVQGFLALPCPGERRVRVDVGNLTALNFYLAAGFKPVAAESVQHLWRAS